MQRPSDKPSCCCRFQSSTDRAWLSCSVKMLHVCVCQERSAHCGLCVCLLAGGGGAGGQSLHLHWRFWGLRGSVDAQTIREGSCFLGSVCAFVCVRVVQGVSIIVLVKRRGLVQQDPMLLGPVPVFKWGRQIVNRFALVCETESVLSHVCPPDGTRGLR